MQWLEYCPHGRKPTCPVCKQTCLSTDAHRLFFQSSSDLSNAKSSSKGSSQSSSPDKKSIEFFQCKVRKLEGQLAVANSALLEHQDQQNELAAKLEQTKTIMEKTMAAQQDSVRQNKHCKEMLFQTQEALERSSLECSNLYEQNATLSKDLAALKLITDVNLEEDDALRLANFGRGANKDDVIDTLLKSLIIRNRTYKELMFKCNGLGRNESVAFRKSAKATEQIKRMRLRIQELERALEEKENETLQFICKSTEPVYQTKRPFASKVCSYEKAFRCFEEATQVEGAHPKSCNSTELVEEAIPKSTNILADTATKSERCYQAALGSFESTSNMTAVTSPSKFACESDTSFFSESQDGHVIGGACAPGDLPSCKQDSLPISIRREAGLEQGLSSAQKTFPGDSEEMSKGGARCLVAANVGSWCHQAQMRIKKRPHSASSLQSNGQSQKFCGSFVKDFKPQSHGGKYIMSGADGRGGQIKVLKSQQSLVVNNLSPKGMKKLKRCKGNFLQRSKTSSRASLQLEHFFCHTSPD